jgi:hypothetical protein
MRTIEKSKKKPLNRNAECFLRVFDTSCLTSAKNKKRDVAEMSPPIDGNGNSQCKVSAEDLLETIVSVKLL